MSMRVNRRFMYWGVFLVAIGAVLVAADVGRLDSGEIANALSLWPLAFVAIGLGVALRGTQFSLPSGMLAAAIPGLMLGGGVALIPQIAAGCGATEAASSVAAREGVFDGPARISVTAGCGSLVVTTAPGGAWRFDADETPGRAPIIDASARSLSIDGGRSLSWRRFDLGRDNWRLTLPTTAIEDLSVVMNAGESRIGLAGARIGNLDVTTNAGQSTVDLTGASVESVSSSVNAGMLSFLLPAADVVGSMEVNAGELQLCAPSELGLRVRHTGALKGISVDGLHQSGAYWQSPNYESAAHRADLNIEVNLGNVEINPIGGCK